MYAKTGRFMRKRIVPRWLSLEGLGFLPAVIPALLLAAVRPRKFPVFASSRRPPSILTINRNLAERLAVLIDIW